VIASLRALLFVGSNNMNIFITGASSGIGQALATEFAARGHTLGLTARRAQALEAFAATLPGKHFTYAVDVNDAAAMRDAGVHFDAHCGGADIVVANAGISVGVLTEHFEDLAVFQEVLMTNVVAMAHTFHPFIVPMRSRRAGQLVGIASVAGIRGLPGSEAYCASKAAVISYCESLRVELKKTGVQVSTICPGFVRTPLTAKNKYAMPFVMDVAPFAKKCADAILSGTSYRVVPWQMGVVAKLLRLLPNWAFDKAFGNRPYKPRSHELKQKS
jgi:short-subunit dehydrogenase